MIRQKAIGDTLEGLKEFLDGYIISEDNPNGIFNSVDINIVGFGNDIAKTLTCTAGDPSVTVLSFSKTNDEWDVTVYGLNTSNAYLTLYSSTASSGAELVNRMDYAYGTDNGFLLHFTYDKIAGDPNLFATVLVTKSKDGYPITVIPDILADPTDNDFTHLFTKVCHYSDGTVLNFAMCQIDTAMQTAAVPFVSYGNHTDLSYSPHAFWMPVSNSYASGFCRMSFNDTECVSNGYWFVDDAQEEGEMDGN